MKYYIVTIGAIFIALGIGILVGFNLNYDQELSKQQANVISDLDSKFEDLKNTNDNLEESLANLSSDYDQSIEFINKNSDKIIVDGLLEKNIGIISTNESNDYTKEIEEIITKANGVLSFNIILTDSIENKEKLKEASNNLNIEIKSTQDLINYITECLKDVNGVTKLQNLQNLELIKLNHISADYLNYESVVLIGGNESKNGNDKFKKIDEVLITKLKEQNKNIVGVQKSNTKFSYTGLYSKNKVTTIDNIDEGIGQVSLVILLSEKGITGNFGRLESADKLLPYKK
jgi:hypothetical protein